MQGSADAHGLLLGGMPDGSGLVGVAPSGTEQYPAPLENFGVVSGFTAARNGSVVVGAGTDFSTHEEGAFKFDGATGAPTFIGDGDATHCDAEWSVSPDGATIAFVRYPIAHPPFGCWGPAMQPLPSGADTGLYIRATDGGVVQRIDPGYQRRAIAWSPDGTKAANLNYDTHAITVLDGTSETTLIPSANLPWKGRISWSPDGRYLLFNVDEPLYQLRVVDVDTGVVRVVKRLDGTTARGESPAWSPDGNMITFWDPLRGNHIAKIDPVYGVLSCDVTIGDQVREAVWASGNAPMPMACHEDGDPVPSPPTGPQDLLDYYRPELHYDQQETYIASNPMMILANGGYKNGVGFGTDFVRENSSGVNQMLLASTNPAWISLGLPRIDTDDISFLNENQYPSSLWAGWPNYTGDRTPSHNDALDLNNDYVEDATALQVSYGNQVYGRIAVDTAGKTWLQYWFFYYYNDFSVLGAGNHEGDWEGIQIGLDAARKPDVVDFNEHDSVSGCPLGDYTALANGAPAVYVAQGSHASYPKAGEWNTEVSGHDDHAHGDGRTARPPVYMVTGNEPWLKWPGRWGGSDEYVDPPIAKPIGLSPRGPTTKDMWTDPVGWNGDASSCSSGFDSDNWSGTEPDPWAGGGATAARLKRRQPLEVQARRRGRSVRLRYRLPPLKKPRAGWPRLLLSLDAPHDRLAPKTIGITARRRHGRRGYAGTYTFPYRTPRGRGLRVLASALTPDGERSRVLHVRVKG